jgi:hypothetical protein
MEAKPTKRTIRVGDAVLEIVEPAIVAAVSADLIIDARNLGGVISLGFAETSADGDNGVPPIARVAARIRLSLPSALDLRNTLDRLLKDTMPGKEKAN